MTIQEIRKFQERKLFEEYLRDEKGYREKTIREYLYYYDKFSNMDLTKDAIYDFIVKKFKNNIITRSAVKAYLKFFNKKYEKDINIEKIMPGRKKNRERKIPEVLSKQEVKALFNGMNSPRNKIMLLLSFYAGLRVSELLNLSPGDFNWNEWVETKDENGNLGNGKLKIREGKGGKERMVILDPSIMRNVYEYIGYYLKGEDEYLFPGINGPMNIRTWQKILQKKGKEILNKNVHPHMLRHSFGYEYINATGDLRSLQTHLGHSNPNTTQIYAKMSNEKMEENYDKFLKSVKNRK